MIRGREGLPPGVSCFNFPECDSRAGGSQFDWRSSAAIPCLDSRLVPSINKDVMRLDRGGSPLEAALGQHILTF